MKKVLAMLATMTAVFGLSGCGSGGAAESSDVAAADSSSDVAPVLPVQKIEACGTEDGYYDDGGEVLINTAGSIAVKFSPGYMPSDIAAGVRLPACATGQFLFNGQCWDSMQFDADSGQLYFTLGGVQTPILLRYTPLSAAIKIYEQNRNAMDATVCNPWSASSNADPVLCTGYSLSYSALASTSTLYSVGAIRFFNQVVGTAGPSVSTSTYNPYKEAAIRTYVNYGKCYKLSDQAHGVQTAYNQMQWMDKGSLLLGGKTYTLPLTYESFKSNLPSMVSKVSCPTDTGDLGAICYKAMPPHGVNNYYTTLVFSSRVDGTNQLIEIRPYYEHAISD